MSNKYDAIIVGSGIGGLTCGAFLARAGLKVLVLEQHFQIGGYTHSFKRRGFCFESAVHSVPMSENGMVMHYLKLLGVADSVKAIPLNSMYTSMWPDYAYTMPADLEELKANLIKDFPSEKDGITALLDSMCSFYSSVIAPVKEGELDELKIYRAFLNKHMNQSYKEYLDSFVKDEKLKRIFYSQWPFGGTPPSQAPVAFYVLMFIMHVMEGSHYMEGGFCKLAETLASVITNNGGEVLTRKKVIKIEVEDGLAKRVITEKGDLFDADLIVSNMSPYVLHRNILDEKHRNKLWLRRLNNLNPSVSSVIIYLGFSAPIDHIIKDNITFWYAHDDDDAIFENTNTIDVTEPDHLVFLNSAHDSAGPTLTIMSFIRQSCSQNWKEDKKTYAQKMLDKTFKLFPEMRDLVSITVTGSPDTFERYTANTGGALYGFENTKSIYGEAKLPLNTHIKNLFQTGHWGKPGGGIWNAMLNGYNAYLTIKKNRE
ncbi:NAD(P)/FAD-dependent oxidoreductase [Chitinispirillales bacterium ANBcel5]|uniref:phytoene desaturase family protein n=1 Tax=Cellulosispirillum alkaliphilum TaxID=3039283 RepID=UPI002A50C574|nr:NAD(P)/FAD-dependent oxidoreductase [Chitinispirillales bacterium ANBcel5]